MQLTRQQQQNEIAINKMIGAMQSRKGWLPPRAIMNYVTDTLSETFGFDITQFDPLWIPVCITATVDWVRITGWWPYYYTSTFHSGEEYKTVWKYVGAGSTEMDPSFYKIFRDDQSASMFPVRRNHPGLSSMEKTEIVSFIRDTYCPQLRVSKPPIEAVERAVWATLMWMCDSYGMDYLCDHSHIISCCNEKDYKMAFLHSFNATPPPDLSPLEEEPDFDIRDNTNQEMMKKVGLIKEALAYLKYEVGPSWSVHSEELYNSFAQFKQEEALENTPLVCKETLFALKGCIEGSDLLDPLKMICTDRPVGTCSNCGQNLWCTSQYHVDMDIQGSTFMCSNCADQLSQNVQVLDLSGENMMSKCQTCLNQECPHLKVETDQYGVSIPKLMVTMGSKQLEVYRQYLMQQPQGTLYGVTADEIAGYYAGNRLGQNAMLGGEA